MGGRAAAGGGDTIDSSGAASGKTRVGSPLVAPQPPDDPAAFGSFDPAKFADPSREFAPGIRWVWPGAAVDDATVRAQVERFADAGYGLLDVQPLAVSFDESAIARDPRLRGVGEPAFFASVRALAAAAREHGMRFDLTLGSGWPNGGIGVPKSASEQQLLWQRSDVSGPQRLDMQLPAASEPSWVAQANELLPNIKFVGPFDRDATLRAVVATPIVDDSRTPPVLGEPFDLTASVHQGRLHWEVPAGKFAVFTLYQNSTAHSVFGGAYPGAPTDALVVDHLSAAGSRWLIDQQLAPWLDPLGEDRPASIFIDSFELVGDLPWSSRLAERYAQHTGRTPYADMPFLFRADGETKYVDIVREKLDPAFTAQNTVRAERAREDYETVRAELFAGEFLAPLRAALKERGVQMRVQSHGGWGVVLDDYANVDVPETESLFAGGSFDFVTLAASAAHVAGTRIVSAESFVTLNLIPEALDRDVLWSLAGHMFSAGINRLIHGSNAYPYQRADGSIWSPFDTTPEVPGAITTAVEPGTDRWSFLPAFNRAQTRISYALTRGASRVDVAWLMSARELRDHPQLAVGGVGATAEESPASATLRAASFTYDRISPSALAGSHVENGRLKVGAASYRALIVDDAQRIDPEVLAQILAAATANVPVIWVGAEPLRALGSVDAAARDARVAELWASASGRLELATSFDRVIDALHTRGVEPEVAAKGILATIGIAQREVHNGRVIWLWNPGPLPQALAVTLRAQGARASWLDPETGHSEPLPLDRSAAGATAWVSLPAARGGIVFLER